MRNTCCEKCAERAYSYNPGQFVKTVCRNPSCDCHKKEAVRENNGCECVCHENNLDGHVCPCHQTVEGEDRYSTGIKQERLNPFSTPPKTNTMEDWATEFVKRFWVYNLETSTPAGAEKEAVQFIADLLTSQREEERKIRENICTVGRNFPARCYECGEKHKSGMSWEEAYRNNALFAKCFECTAKELSTHS